jgi:hypothetical protein
LTDNTDGLISSNVTARELVLTSVAIAESGTHSF